MYPPRNFIVLNFTFRFMIPFNFFLIWVEARAKFLCFCTLRVKFLFFCEYTDNGQIIFTVDFDPQPEGTCPGNQPSYLS